MMIERGHEQLPDRETVRLARAGAAEIGRLLKKLPASDSAPCQAGRAGHDSAAPGAHPSPGPARRHGSGGCGRRCPPSC